MNGFVEVNRKRRGHMFRPTVDVIKRTPKPYATDGVPLRDKVATVHYFVGGWDWYVFELDTNTWEAFGLVVSPDCPDGEMGYFFLTDLERQRPAGWLVVERDMWWEPTPVSEIGRVKVGA